MLDNQEDKTLKESWDNVVKTFLKAEHLKEPKGKFVVHDLEIVDNDGIKKLHLSVTVEDKDYTFIPNWTNTTFLKKNSKSPKDLIGKVLTYEKIKQRNPITNQMVDSILITSAE